MKGEAARNPGDTDRKRSLTSPSVSRVAATADDTAVEASALASCSARSATRRDSSKERTACECCETPLCNWSSLAWSGDRAGEASVPVLGVSRAGVVAVGEVRSRMARALAPSSATSLRARARILAMLSPRTLR